ncbi:MAG: pyruvate kinase [Myxococcales bacterium]|nr:pyruvate kinase [Myxococcales bacterium]USN50520.1 MAG: pyruvate kinase [Myxococcales bacterium]
MQRKVKIICTLGPSSYDEVIIEDLIKSGMNIARLNFSHGDHGFYRILINRIRHAAAKLGVPVAILQDLQGPKIRVGKMPESGVELQDGQHVFISIDEMIGSSQQFYTPYAAIINDVDVNDPILLDDGKISLVCEKKESRRLFCRVEQGGVLKSNKGINLPHSATSTPSLSSKDIRDLNFGAHAGVDAVALSFVRSAQDVIKLRAELASTKTRPLIIAKLEKQQAIDDLENILRVSDGVMVARGDLGVEMPAENVPLVQKRIIERALAHGKTAVVATEMLESMITQVRPTRAEASDVANAVLDGTDMLMLSAETAAGAHPIKAVSMMSKIARHVEESNRASYWRTSRLVLQQEKRDIQNTMCLGAVQACEVLKASAIVMFSNSGMTARMVSAYRPQKPIIAFVPDAIVQRTLAFSWGVRAFVLKAPERSMELFASINKQLLETGEFQVGERVIVLTKIPLRSKEHTNTVHVHTLKSVLSH